MLVKMIRLALLLLLTHTHGLNEWKDEPKNGLLNQLCVLSLQVYDPFCSVCEVTSGEC